MTIEEFFRKKIKETYPFKEVGDLSNEIINVEEAIKWALEFNSNSSEVKSLCNYVHHNSDLHCFGYCTECEETIEIEKSNEDSINTCDTCKHLLSNNPYPCGSCDDDYCMWEKE